MAELYNCCHAYSFVLCSCFQRLGFASPSVQSASRCVDPKYLNWCTSSSTFPSIYMLVDGLALTLLTRILLLLELISIPYPAAVFSSLSVSYCSSSLPPRRSMLPANRKLQSDRPPVAAKVSKSSALLGRRCYSIGGLF